jgi:DNA-directed RNA polymerase
MEGAECPAVYEAINILQRTAWAINQPVLDVFRAVLHGRWDCDNLKIPVWGAEELPKRPDVEKDSPVYAVWRREFRQAKERQSSNRTRALQCARISFLAEVYAGSPIYFVHMLDFRGRAYPLGGGLQYQGDDRQRGMLRFDAGKEIGSQQAAEWFLIHGANCWGADKLSFEGRLSWVEENTDNIKATAADPLSFRWWVDADKPWQFLAWCFEAVGYFRDGLKHYSYIPIGMDGSNNGLQLYSLLLKDPVGGAATNCVPSDKPQDIYMEVANKVNKRLAAIRHDLAADPQHRKWADQLLSYWPEGLPRAAVKRPVMTLPYGAMHHTCQRYLASWYHDEVRGKRLNPPPFPNMDAYDAMTWIGKLVWEEIGSTVIAAMSGMKWLRAVSDICATKGRPVSWVSPSGFAVTQHYQQGRSKHIVFTLDRPVHIFIRQDTKKISTRKHRNGIAPNFIHSLDAALMVETVNQSYAKGVESFMMIHDSFATHACDAPVMADTLRQCAVEMFSGNLLEDLRRQLTDQTGLELPECPPQGTLDLTLLQHSKYFFA